MIGTNPNAIFVEYPQGWQLIEISLMFVPLHKFSIVKKDKMKYNQEFKKETIVKFSQTYAHSYACIQILSMFTVKKYSLSLDTNPSQI